jgi:hypothetical protein
MAGVSLQQLVDDAAKPKPEVKTVSVSKNIVKQVLVPV